MPMKLSTTISKIQTIPNQSNLDKINEFLNYMKNNGSSEHHQNNNLKVVISFAKFLGPDTSFYDINRKEQSTLCLSSFLRDTAEVKNFIVLQFKPRTKFSGQMLPLGLTMIDSFRFIDTR